MSDLTRRRFVGSAAALSAATVVPRQVLGGPGRVAPNDKIHVAHIGMGTQGFREIGSLLARPEIQITAVCDPNTDSNDYIEWGKGGIRRKIAELIGKPDWRSDDPGCPGGREVGRIAVDGYYAKSRDASHYRACRAYADFRELLDKESDLDAVKIMTPDHLHAAIALSAMKRGLHVVSHKPIANRLYEGRLVIDTAKKTGVSTHLLAYGSGKANGQIVAQIKRGAIGKLREIHNWTNRPVWPQYPDVPKDRPPVPEGFDWRLWLGPERDRPYHPHYTHTVFRGWYDFGGGSLADMGIYSLWPVFTGLGLETPVSAEAHATHTCTIEGGVSRVVKNTAAYPIACMQRLRFAATAKLPAVDLFWYDGGMKPRLPDELESQGARLDRSGILFIGDDGAILAEFHGREPRLYTAGKNEPLAVDSPAENGATDPVWLAAYQGLPSPGSFPNAAAITDAVNLGTVALRAGGEVVFDSAKMKITGSPDATSYLYREYREGWEL